MWHETCVVRIAATLGAQRSGTSHEFDMTKASDAIRDAAAETEAAIEKTRENVKNRVNKARQAATQARDEAKLQTNLFGKEAKTQFEALQGRWKELDARFIGWQKNVREDAAEVKDAAGEELTETYDALRDGFERIKAAIVK